MTKDLKYILDKISGFLSIHEAQRLYQIASFSGGTIIEIGSLYGRSTVVLAEALKDAKKDGIIYAVDPGYLDPASIDTFRANIQKYGVERYIRPLAVTSEEASHGWTMPIDLLWVDGDHSYKIAEKDFLLWEPHLKNGGTIAYHDATFNYPDVRRVVSKYIFRSRHFRNVGFVDNLVFATKCGKNSYFDFVRNMFILGIKNLVTSSIYIKPPRWLKDMVKPAVRFMAGR